MLQQSYQEETVLLEVQKELDGEIFLTLKSLTPQANQFQLNIIGNGGLTEVFRLTENSNIVKDNFMLNLAA